MHLDESTKLMLAVGLGTLLLVVLAGGVVLLMALSNNRRNKHRAQMAEVRERHSQEVRKVEREVLTQTLTDVGQELHDNIGQLLTATRAGVFTLMDMPGADGHVHEVKEALETAIAEVRRLSKTLNAERLLQVPLEEAIRQECDRMTRMGGAQVVFQCSASAQVSEDHKVVLFRIFQEVMNNATKHARADRIDVALEGPGAVRLTITDNGRGFDVAAMQAKAGGQGLGNLKRRAELIGYSCDITSAPGRGTSISVHT
jgi:signal transduction histidine kinase